MPPRPPKAAGRGNFHEPKVESTSKAYWMALLCVCGGRGGVQRESNSQQPRTPGSVLRDQAWGQYSVLGIVPVHCVQVSILLPTVLLLWRLGLIFLPKRKKLHLGRARDIFIS